MPPAQIVLTADKLPAIALRPGQTLQGIVQANENGSLFVRAGTLNIPLESAGALTQGQSVTVEVTAVADGRLQLRITPNAAPAVAAEVPALAGALGALAQFQSLAPSIPPFLAPRDTWLRQLAAAWFGRPGDAAAADEWTSLLQSAARAGWQPPAALQSLLDADGGAPEHWGALLRALAPSNLAEAKFAAAVAEGAETGGDAADLRTAIARLLGDGALRGHLETAGKADAFDTLSRGLMERLDRAALANTLGLEHRYAFWELPMPGGGHARIHSFGGESGGGKQHGKEAPDYGFVAMDLELSRLGRLWITLRRTGATCECGLHAPSEETIGLLREARAELAEGLGSAGYGRPKITIGRWHGDPLRSLAEGFETEKGAPHGR
ncbi:MAG: hypothetical protein GC168_01645 [Candidatus Hydrogenedens sp.]|nr:hypothetical protein [Candidatus Hydrogenedens sp.]